MHLRTETALDLLEERMELGEKTFWKEHVQNCDTCRYEISVWQQLEVDMKRWHLKSAPEEDLKKAFQIFPKPAEQSFPALRHILATIMFDSFRAHALTGSRGTAAA